MYLKKKCLSQIHDILILKLTPNIPLAFSCTLLYQAHLAYRHAHLDYLRRRKSQHNLDTKPENNYQNLRNGYSETNLYESSNRVFAPPVTPTKQQSRPSPVKLCNFMHEFTVSEPNFGSLPARIHAM